VAIAEASKQPGKIALALSPCLTGNGKIRAIDGTQIDHVGQCPPPARSITLAACEAPAEPQAQEFLMNYGYGSSEEHQPLMWVRGIPLFAAHMIVLILVVSMLATSLLMAFGGSAVLEALSFSSNRVLMGEVWRVLTYGLINPPSLWFAIDMAMIIWFGRELEKMFGRRNFLWLYAGLYLTPVLLMTLLGGFGWPTTLAGQTGGFGIFIAFATLYPNVAMLFGLLAKWVALVLVGVYSLIALSNRNWIALLSLWSTVGFASSFVLYVQGRLTFPTLSKPEPPTRPRFRESKPLTAKTIVGATVKDTSMAEVDALLDKIAQSGISSLTAKERARLDAAHKNLKNRPPRK